MKPVRIYSLPGDFSEEEKAVIFAKCARSPESFTEIAKTVTKEGAEQFHEKFVVNYGHASVGEMAIPDFAFEGVSILASKILESMPRGAYQEKSTRAQNFLFKDDHGNYTAYYIPPGLDGEKRCLYIESMEALFKTYEELHDPMMAWATKKTGSDKFVAKRRAFDSLRYLLPVGTQTNLGMRINGRDLAVLIVKLLSSPIAEFRVLGVQLKEVALKILPTLVRHTDSNSYLNLIREMSEKEAEAFSYSSLIPKPQDRNYCAIIHEPAPEHMNTDQYAVMRIASAFMSHYGKHSPLEIRPSLAYPEVKQMCYDLVEGILEKRGSHDPFPDEFDVIQFTADMVMDYGAFRDLQRHRFCTQLPQWPQLDLGYDVPSDVLEAGGEIEEKFVKTLQCASTNVVSLEQQCEDDPALYGVPFYATPLAFRHRMLMQMSLKQSAYMIELRSRPQGHISYRRIVKELHDGLMELYPTIVRHIRCHDVPTPQSYSDNRGAR